MYDFYWRDKYKDMRNGDKFYFWHKTGEDEDDQDDTCWLIVLVSCTIEYNTINYCCRS